MSSSTTKRILSDKDGGGGVGLGEDKSSAPHKRIFELFLELNAAWASS
jgi:hypothetical protein